MTVTSCPHILTKETKFILPVPQMKIPLRHAASNHRRKDSTILPLQYFNKDHPKSLPETSKVPFPPKLSKISKFVTNFEPANLIDTPNQRLSPPPFLVSAQTFNHFLVVSSYHFSS